MMEMGILNRFDQTTICPSLFEGNACLCLPPPIDLGESATKPHASKAKRSCLLLEILPEFDVPILVNPKSFKRGSNSLRN